jgi:hypothetical protein
MRLTTAFLFMFLFFTPLTSETIPEQASVPKDIKIVINESMVNKVLTAIGPVSGKGESSKIKYKWKVKEPVIRFEEGRAKFYAKAKIKAKGLNYDSKVKGHCDVSYNSEKNKIKIKVKSAKFKLEFKVFGQKISLGSIDVAKFYSPEFKFDGPEPINQTISIDLPDGKKDFQLISGEPEMFIKPGVIEVASTVVIKEIVPVETPVETQAQADIPI